MDEKLQTIYNITQQIREIVDDECIPLEDLPEAIKDKLREGGAGGSGFTTAFAFSSTNSIAPTSEKMNMSTGLVENLDEGWSQTNNTDADHLYMSYAIFDGWGDIQHTWASPVDLNGKNGSVGPKGEKGDKGDLGPQGPSGIDGQDGKDGIDGSTYEYVYFRGLTEDDKPINIPSGEGNNQDDYKPTYTKTVEINGVQTTLKWEDRAQGVSSTFKYEWRSERSKKDTSTWNDFTEPILWAKYGEKGKDGDGVQYIFTITKEFDAPNHPYPTGWETDPEYQNNESDEYIPKPVDGQIWKDDPIEVDDINRYCWVSVRKYRNGKWGRYSNPTLWTKWTESSGVITGDVIALDIDPNWVMLNEDENEVKTTVTAYRGSDKVVIQNITCDEGGFTFTPEYNESKTEWYLTFSNIEAASSNTYIKLNIALSDDDVRTKTFTIYHTKFSAETVTLDFKDDNILVPCSDGSTPDSGFFNNFLVPMVMRVNGEEKTIVNIAPNNSTYNDLFELVDDGKSLQVKGFPGSGSTNTIDFTAKDAEDNSASASLRFTKFNTAGGELVMYTLNVNASDIVADQRNDTYTVYTWQENDRSNIIKVNVNEYSSSNSSKVINLKDLDSNYKVFYANDPYDWAEDELDEEWRIMSDSGLYIGTTDIDGVPGIAPDSCVAFQLRHWVNTTKAINWENCTEDDYEIQDAEILKVDIIQEIASYKFVVNPTFFHKRVNGTIDPAEIQIGLSKNVAGDGGNSEYIPINKIPLGYDLYYEINGTQTKIHGEDEQGSLPCGIPISNTNGDINLYLVTNEHSDDEGKVVLSETIEMRSELPGEPAYIGFLAPPVGIVRCDADGNPDANHSQLTTKFFVTNAKSVSVNKPTVIGCNVSVSGDEITFKDFNNNLSQNTIVTITANYTDANDIPASTRAKYQIIKNNNAKSTIVTQLSNPSAIVQLIDDKFRQKTVSTKIQAREGEEFAQITDINIKSVKLDGNIISSPSSYPVSMSYELDESHRFEDNTIEFTLSDDVSKLSIGEHTITVDLNIVINGLNYIETQTILIQKSGGENAVHLELTNDREYVTGNNLNCETLARLYDGYAPAMGVTYSADFGNNLEGTISESGKLQVTGIKEGISLINLDENITITAKYKNELYTKIFNVKYNNSNWRLLITPSVIDADDPEDLKITMMNGSDLVKDNSVQYTYTIDDGTPISFEMPEGKGNIEKEGFSSIKNKLVVSAKIEENGKVTILDEETVGVVRDGENAQYYQIDANHRWIVKKSDGTVVAPTESITPIFQKINGTEFTQRSFDELTHDGYYVCKSINGAFNATKLTENTLSTIPSSVNTQLVYYLFKNSVAQPSAESGWDDYVEIDVTAAEKGDPGESGNDAPIIYPAGVWDEEKAYKVEVDRVPYVFYAIDNKYYMLNHDLFKTEGETSWSGLNSAPGKLFEEETPIWLPIDSFEAIYADIGLFNQALVGKWVFHGDYMFSQEGILGQYSGNKLIIPQHSIESGEQCTYSELMNGTVQGYSAGAYNSTIQEMNLWQRIKNEIWIPNVLFNAVTGEGWFAGKKIQFNVDGSGSLGNGITWNNDGDLTVKGSIFNPVASTMNDVLDKTISIPSKYNLTNPVTINAGSYNGSVLSDDAPIKKIGTVTLMSTSTSDPIYVKLSDCYLTVSHVIGNKNGAVENLVKDFSEFVLAPGAIVTFDIYDNKSKHCRCLIPQYTFGWFTLNGAILPYSCASNCTYEQLCDITSHPDSIGTSLEGARYSIILDLPENVIEYMSVKLSNPLHSTFGNSIYFGKKIDNNTFEHGNVYSSSTLLNETYISPKSVVTFREGGSFGFGNYSTGTISNLNSPNITIKLFNNVSMIGYYSFTL